MAVADLHGHPKHLDALLRHLDEKLGEPYHLVLLGDYVDNGPDIPGLLGRLLELQSERPGRFTPILGNHDLACLRVLGWPRKAPDPVWYQNWKHYWGWRGPDGSTPLAYGADSAAELAERMPASHVDFLRSLPWYFDTGRYFFVHSGLNKGPIAPQRDALEARALPVEHTHLPPAIREKALATVTDDTWDRVVVSGHTAKPGQKVPHHPYTPHFMSEKRICLSAEIDRTGVLYAIALPQRRIVRVAQDLAVKITTQTASA